MLFSTFFVDKVQWCIAHDRSFIFISLAELHNYILFNEVHVIFQNFSLKKYEKWEIDLFFFEKKIQNSILNKLHSLHFLFDGNDSDISGITFEQITIEICHSVFLWVIVITSFFINCFFLFFSMCVLGKRLLKDIDVFRDCNKNTTGPLYKQFCGTGQCDPYFSSKFHKCGVFFA